MSSRRLIARNAIALLVSDVAVRGLAAVGTVLIARSLGPQSYGTLGVAVAFSLLVGYLCDVGITHLTVQKATLPGANLTIVLGSALKVRFLLAGVTTVCSVVWIAVSYSDPERRNIMFLVALPTIWGVTLQGFGTSYFWITEEMHYSAMLRATAQMLTAIALITAFLAKWPLHRVALIYGMSSLAGGVLTLVTVRGRLPSMAGWDRTILDGFASFTLCGVTGMMLPQLGILILERVADGRQAGYFTAATRIPSIICAIPSVIAMAWYPRLFYEGSRDRERHFALSVDEFSTNAILGFGLHWTAKAN